MKKIISCVVLLQMIFGWPSSGFAQTAKDYFKEGSFKSQEGDYYGAIVDFCGKFSIDKP